MGWNLWDTGGSEMLLLAIACLAFLNLIALLLRILNRWSSAAETIAVIIPLAALAFGFGQYSRDKNEAQRLFELSLYAEEEVARAALATTSTISHSLITGCMAISVAILGITAWRKRSIASVTWFSLLLLLFLTWIWLQYQEWPTRIG